MAKKKEKAGPPKLGAQYQAVKLGVQLAGPPVDHAISNPQNIAAAERNLLGSRAYWEGAGVALVDQWGSKKIGHAAAISRNSVTALAPEFLVGLRAVEAGGDTKGSISEYIARTDGFDSRSTTFDANRVKEYGVVKYGLGLGRKFVNGTRIAEPVKRFLGMLGATL